MLISLQNKISNPVDYKSHGYDFLVNNARVFHDFTQLSGDHGSTITSSNDLTANNRDLINNPSGYSERSPTLFRYRFQDLDTYNTLYSFNNNPLLFATNTTNAIFATSHEVHISLSAKSKNFILRLFGINSTQVHFAQIETTGKVSLSIKRAATTTLIRSVDPVFTPTVENADLGNVIALSFAYNFTYGSEFAKMYVNGVEIATELISGSDPTDWNAAYTWNNIYSFAVGAEAAAVNTTGNSKPHWTYKFAVTEPLTQDQRNIVVHELLSTEAQRGKIVILGDSKMPFCTATKTYYCPVYLSHEPTSNVTVNVSEVSTSLLTITGTELTFTPANYNVPQMVKVVGSASQGYKEVDLSFIASGGFVESKTKKVIISESRTGTGGKNGSDVYLTDGWNATRVEANAIEITNDNLKDAIIATIFKGNYPTGGPSNTTTPTSYGVVTLANANAGTKSRFTFVETDENGYTYTNYIGHVRNTSPNDKLFIDLFGHGESFHQELYDAVIATGYDWAGGMMAFTSENEENNPNITASPSWLAHDQLFTNGVDTETFDARRLFFFDKIRFIEYILTQHSYTKIVIAGVSGGGWMATMLGSMLDNVDVIFEVRGCNSFGHPESGSDFEQGPDFLAELTGGAKAVDGKWGPRVTKDYREYGYLVRMALCSYNGADFHHISHELDPLGGANYNEMALGIMQTKTNGKYFQYINKDSGQSTHGYGTNERNYIINNLP